MNVVARKPADRHVMWKVKGETNGPPDQTPRELNGPLAFKKALKPLRRRMTSSGHC
jgi:hypothetical protein